MSVHNFAETIVAGSSAQGGGVTEQSLKFNDAEDQSLVRYYDTNGNRKTWTWSGWLKRSTLGTAQRFWGTINGSSQEENIRFETSDKIRWYSHNAGGGAADNDLTTDAVFRDVSSWYHIQIVKDTTESTAANRNKLYVNGVLQSWAGSNYASLNYDGWINTAGSDNPHRIGAHPYGGTSAEFDGYMADIHFIDGQALAPTSFGETVNGSWTKKDYTGTYGTNGFKLNFQDDVVSEGFNAVTYRGNGGTQSISGLGFEPDFVWIKNSGSTYDHMLFDSVRGTGNYLESNTTDAQASGSHLTSFDADGFTVGAGSSSNRTNFNGNKYVGWCWDAGGATTGSNSAGAGNVPTAGSVKINGVNSTSALSGTLPALELSANTTRGFSIIRWNGTATDGATIAHGLTTAPNMIITKSLSNSTSWVVGIGNISGFGVNDYLNLQTTGVKATSTTFYQAYGSDTFTVGVSAANEMNKTSNGYVSYCFAEVAGYSSIGSYSGTGAAGNAVTGLGFKPAFLMVKGTDVAEHWVMFDNTRSPANPVDQYLLANSNGAEATGQSTRAVDFDTDGFTVDGTQTEVNQSGKNYLYMAFADTREAAFFKDVSGQGNHFTPINLDYRDSLIDSPANNFATLNPLQNSGGGGNWYAQATLSEGNLQASLPANSVSVASMKGTGKLYAEVRWTTVVNEVALGLIIPEEYTTTTAHPNNTGPNSWRMAYHGYSPADIFLLDEGTSVANPTQTVSVGDIFQVAWDTDSGKIWFGYNNSWYDSSGGTTGNPSTGANATMTATTADLEASLVYIASGNATGVGVINFGQDSTFAGATTAGGNTDSNGIGTFKYAPPAGYLALCTSNLADPTIADPSDHFNTVLWTGDGTASNSIAGVGFEPDLVWTKARNYARHHWWYDQVRGAQKRLQSSNSDAESDAAAGLISFNADGFTYQYESNNGFNTNNETYASWTWKAGGEPTATNSAGAGNVPTSGSVMIDGVASTTALNGDIPADKISANTKSGFSIVAYTGTGATNPTVNHGLTKTPEFIILKDRDANSNNNNWNIWHKDAGDGNDYGYFTPAAFTGNAQVIGTDNNVFTLKPNLLTTNESGDEYITYLFHSVEGMTKVGSYTGNNSANGPFVYTGFVPAFVIIKSASQSSSGWYLFDNKRETFNARDRDVYVNAATAEIASGGGDTIDFLSNGFKLRSNRLYLNGSGTPNYIYIAFAEIPFKTATAR